MPKTKSKSKPTAEVPQQGIRHPVSISDTGTRFYHLIVGPNVKVIEDKKSKTRVANFPFEFPDGTRGIAIICRIKDEAWDVGKDIKDMLITFK